MNVIRRPHIAGAGLLTVFIFLAGADRSLAQSTSMFGSRGPAGQIGTNATGSPVGRSSTLGSTGSTGQPAGGRSFDGFGTGNANALSGTGTTGGPTLGQRQQFVGQQDSTGRFVGNQTAGQQPATGRTPNRSTRALNRQSTNQNDFNTQNLQNGRDRSRTSRVNVRPQQRIAFSYPQPSTGRIATTLETRLGRVSDRQSGLTGITVTAESDGIVVLSGDVDSEGDKRLAAMIARLEPGVRSVRNELTVRSGE